MPSHVVLGVTRARAQPQKRARVAATSRGNCGKPATAAHRTHAAWRAGTVLGERRDDVPMRAEFCVECHIEHIRPGVPHGLLTGAILALLNCRLKRRSTGREHTVQGDCLDSVPSQSLARRRRLMLLDVHVRLQHHPDVLSPCAHCTSLWPSADAPGCLQPTRKREVLKGEAEDPRREVGWLYSGHLFGASRPLVADGDPRRRRLALHGTQ